MLVILFNRISSLCPKVQDLYLSNRFLIYTLQGLGHYIIYDFFHKRLITDRPIITSLRTIDIGSEEITCNNRITYIWVGEDRLILSCDDNDILNLWDIETNELFSIQFEVNRFTVQYLSYLYLYYLYLYLYGYMAILCGFFYIYILLDTYTLIPNIVFLYIYIYLVYFL